MTTTAEQGTRRRRPVVRRVVGWLATGVTAVLIAIVAAVLLVRVLLGWQPLIVLSGSMEPTIPTGSIFVVDPVDGPDDIAEVQVGDVSTFLPHPDDPVTVTHRAVARTATTKGPAICPRVDIADVQVGDVITFLPHPDDPGTVPHRVVAMTATTKGPAFRTQGGALAQPDPEPVTETQLRGVVRYHVPHVGYLGRVI